MQAVPVRGLDVLLPALGFVKVRLHERVREKKWLGLRGEYRDEASEATLRYVFLVKEIYPPPRELGQAFARSAVPDALVDRNPPPEGRP